MAATRRLKELISATSPKLELPDGPVVVALSGGADSATLAFLSREAGHPTTAMHVDHQLPGSPKMAQAASTVADRLDIALTTQQVVLGEGPSPEKRARDARYAVFSESDGPILTGHTRDDSVETMLINLTRGTGPSGLVGIPRFRPPHIYRPMLDITRSQTREIAVLADLPFVDDPMNEDMSLTRNRIRLNILPLMRELNPQIDAALARAGATLESDSKYLDGLAETYHDRPLPVSVVATLPKVIADRLLHRALETADITPTADRIERMWSVVSGDSDREDLADGRTVVRRASLLVIE